MVIWAKVKSVLINAIYNTLLQATVNFLINLLAICTDYFILHPYHMACYCVYIALTGFDDQWWWCPL